jgi:DNA-binding MurR/RpiR family transcriptional regulator
MEKLLIRTAATANQLHETLQQYAEFLLDNKERPKQKSVLSFTKQQVQIY